MLDTVKDSDALVLAAWLYHVRGLSQQEVGQSLGLSRFQVNRMLAEAREAGIVRITVEHETTAALALADALRQRWELAEVLVAPLPAPLEADADYARRAVGLVAARFLHRVGSDGPSAIGVGWGRTVAAMAEALSGLRNRDLCFVSLMGSLVRTSATSPFDVCARLAALTGGQALFLPAPFLADSAADRAVILRQRLVRETLAAARKVDHAIISVGECTPDALLFASGVLTAEDGRALRAAGAVADTTGMFFQADGSLADTDLNRRAPSVGLDDLRACEVSLLAAGCSKATAVRAALQAGFVDRLIVDERLGRMLAAAPEGSP
ncbi:MAG: transcriptional regulator [Geminicoccaceae bacterium]|nr:MAG: transcriptional regulator [Geminicoccaceae bacterium]